MSIEETLAQLRIGKLAVLIDDSGVQSRGHLIGVAQGVTPEQINFFVCEARAIICAPISSSRARELSLPLMVPAGSLGAPAFTVSVEARTGVTTGISAADRAQTLNVLASTSEPQRDLVQPGHIFPIVTENGGVLSRKEAAEALIDLLRLAGLVEVGVISLILGVDGEELTAEGLVEFATRHRLPTVSISDIIQHRMNTEQIVEKIAEAQLPIGGVGIFRAHGFRSLLDSSEHLVLTKGEFPLEDPVLARVQTENPLGDLFTGEGIFTHQRNLAALSVIEQEGKGIFAYIRHPRRGLLQRRVESIANEGGASTAKMDLREYGIGSKILRHFGASRIRLLSNATGVLPNLTGFNIEVVERVPFPDRN